MAREKKIENPVTLFATIESAQHDALRTIAFNQRRSLADVVREALDMWIQGQPKNHKEDTYVSVTKEERVQQARRA